MNDPIPYDVTPSGWAAVNSRRLPNDYCRCFGILDTHTATPDCPRRLNCARFVAKPDHVPAMSPVTFGLCGHEEDFFIPRHAKQK